MKNEITEYLRRIGSKGGKAGGKARMAGLTRKQRTELARTAARARWKKATGTRGAKAP